MWNKNESVQGICQKEMPWTDGLLFGFNVVYRILSHSFPADQEYRTQWDKGDDGKATVVGYNLVDGVYAEYHKWYGYYQADEQRWEWEFHQLQHFVAAAGAEGLANGNITLALSDEIDTHGSQS